MNRVPLRMDFTEINPRGESRELLGRIDGQNSRFRTAKTIGLHASFVELESAKNALNKREWKMILYLWINDGEEEAEFDDVPENETEDEYDELLMLSKNKSL
ncbi:hypothetical protein TNCV_4099391 [Trichonephila clavipes]|nr:hypothetical protein TNCV_4099391 [Trichonephila clavipes]